MSEVYYVSFTIAADADYDRRYDRVVGAIHACTSGTFWDQTTSLILFETEDSAQEIADAVSLAMNPRTDVAIVGSPNTKTMLVLGANSDGDIFKIVPFAKKA